MLNNIGNYIEFAYKKDVRTREVENQKLNIISSVVDFIHIYDIPQDIINKYNICLGDISPFSSRLIWNKAIPIEMEA